VLSVHLALTKETRGFVGRAILERLKPGSLFINTARGELVDEAALADVVRTRGVRAGLDVFASEPAGATGEFASALASLTSDRGGAAIVYGTHHVGASTDQAQEAIAAEAVRVIRAY